MRQLFRIVAVLFWLLSGAIFYAAHGGDRPAIETHEAGAAGSRDGRRKWTRRLIKLGALALLLAGGGFLVVASGITPIKASSGHWAITAWFLDFAKVRSVDTHTKSIQAPELDEPRLVLRGAGHYETGCRPCHGSPGLPMPSIPRKMTPHPPYLPPRIDRWEPEELFYIVKHGIKFTGMPAWPAQQRDDEVWAVVAFLLELPELDTHAYRELVEPTPASTEAVQTVHGLLGADAVPRAVLENCGRCHGRTGLGRGLGAFPRLAGQRPAYLRASLDAYASGKRHSGIMEPIAVGLSAEEINQLALYYAQLDPAQPATDSRGSSPAIERGGIIARLGLPQQRVPACVDCHGPTDQERNPIYPELAGQYAEYLVLQLQLFKKEFRGGTAYEHLMHPVAGGLTVDQMRDVALYYESLTPQPE